MRDIQRYSPVGDGVAKTDVNGMLVAYGEYRVLEAHYDMAKTEVERLTAFTTRTIIPNEELQAQVKALRIELADAQENNHILNETIAMMLKKGKQS